MIKADKNILDISYSVSENRIAIQFVLLIGSTMSKERVDILKKELATFDIGITEIYLTKEQFNESKGEWQSHYYSWLDYLLFSKAEIL